MRITGEPTRGPSTLRNCLKNTVPHGIRHLPSAAGHEFLVVALPKTIYHLPHPPLQRHFSRQSLLVVQDTKLVEIIL